MPMSIEVDETTYQARQVAGYKGVRVWQVGPSRQPHPAPHRRRTPPRLRRAAHRLRDDHTQEWRWPRSAIRRAPASRGWLLTRTSSGPLNEALDQRLAMIEIGFYESPSVPDSYGECGLPSMPTRSPMSSTRSSSSSTTRLVKAISGLDVEGDRKWYSALLMNRLMFIYFMQRKGFLDNDRDYLRTRLHASAARAATAISTSSIGTSCCRCSTMVSALPAYMSPTSSSRISSATSPTSTAASSPSTNSKPPHTTSASPTTSSSPSSTSSTPISGTSMTARPASQNEINPDVLGYIFEQFINQKEQGAYYTKDDVTHFMTSPLCFPSSLNASRPRPASTLGLRCQASQPPTFGTA